METSNEIHEEGILLSEEMKIKIQTFDNNFPITVNRSATVSDLKEKIKQLTNIPGDKQRLIFQGKLLQTNDKLSQYKINDDNVIHLVAKTLEDQENSSNNPSNTQNNQETQNINLDDLYNGIIEIPIIRANRRSRRRRGIVIDNVVPQFDISESFESMHQNVLSIKNMQNCQNKFDNDMIINSKTITGFDFSKTQYEVGQWVDVKDTINQWLEAQIIQIRGNLAYVHYNGWGNRWDEWIEFSSPRIAPFKTYTMQSPNSIFLSPYPSVVPDANVESQKRSIDTFYYMEKSVEFMSQVSKYVEVMNKLRKASKREFKFDETKSEEENQKLKKEEESKYYKLIENQGYQLNNVDNELLFMCSQIIPLMDRTGRLISDIALHLSHLMSNSNLYPQLFLGYMINTGQNDSTISNSNPSISSNINHPNNNSNNSPNINTDNNPLNFYNSILNSLQQNQQTNNQTNAQNIQHSIHHQNSVHQSNTRLPNQTNLQNDLNMSQINSLLSQLSPLNNASGDNITTRNNIFAQNSSSVIDTNLFEIQSNHPRDSTPENNQNTDIKVDKKEIENLNTAKQVSEDQGSIQADQDLRKNSYADLENKDVPRKDIKLNNDSETILEKTINDDSNPRNNLRDSEKSSRKQSMNIKKFKDSLPKINLQVPAILCQGEINQAGNFVNVEPNIDIYVHTIVAPTNRTTTSSNQTSQATHTSNSNVNSSNTVNNNNIQQNNIDSNVSAESLINNLISNQRNIRTDNTSSLNQYAALLESMTSLLNNPRRNDNTTSTNNAQSFPNNNVLHNNSNSNNRSTGPNNIDITENLANQNSNINTGSESINDGNQNRSNTNNQQNDQQKKDDVVIENVEKNNPKSEEK